MAKFNPGLGSNQTIRDAIQKIALHGIIDPKTNAPYSDAQYAGCVVAIHGEDEQDETLRGTVDVREYANPQVDGSELVHKGVYLTAIQNNRNGLVIIPKLWSDVIVTINPIENIEYVAMFSHADIVRIDSHEQVTIGVREREEFNINDDESGDIDDLKETGIHAVTTYVKDSATTEVQGDGSDKTSQVMDSKQFKVVAGDDKTVQTITQDKAEIVHGKSKATLDDNGAVMETGNSSVTVEDGTVHLGSKTNTDDAVLGGALADVLSDIVSYLAQGTTTTMMGPQPIVNQVPNFIAMQAKIKAWKAAHSGFLTQKVKVQK